MIDHTSSVDRYTVSGASYTINFPYWKEEEVKAVITLSDGTMQDLVLNTDYSVSTPDGNNGTLTKITAWTDADKLTIYRESELDQPVDLVQGQKINADTVENAFDHAIAINQELQEKLGLPKMPYQIECFDNSNISGTDAVAACVVFKSMKPSKKDYKKYNIKTVVGPDDYASMKEVVHRRYSRLLEEEEPLPDLIVADGGKGQMEVIREVIQDELNLDIPIAGLAKDNRHRTNELLYGFPPRVIGLKTDSELFHVLTQLQDEVHRFAITFHREKRSKRALESELDNIKGVGPKTRDELLNGLKSVKRISEANLDTLTDIVGAAKAKIVYDYFHEEKGRVADSK